MLDYSLLEKIYLGSQEDAINDCLTTYHVQGYLVLNYIYFAQLMSQRLVEGTPEPLQQQYMHALRASDFFFADGIALQLFYLFTVGAGKKMPPSLNGTDFSPLFLHRAIQQYGAENIHLAVFNVRDASIGKDEQYINQVLEYLYKTFGCKVKFVRQCQYRERAGANPREEYSDSLTTDTSALRIVLNFVGAPYQEIMTDTAMDIVRSNRVLVMNQGGTIDFWMGVEKRAPKRVVKARILETLRRICANPQKNIRKLGWMFGVFRVLGKAFLLKLKRIGLLIK